MTTFTATQGIAGREFLALGGFLAAFGIPDPKRNNELYFEEKTLHYMEMNGKFPANWKPVSKPWGSKDVVPIVQSWSADGVPGVSDQLAGLLWLVKHFG
jgi:hypothetical protein